MPESKNELFSPPMARPAPLFLSSGEGKGGQLTSRDAIVLLFKHKLLIMLPFATVAAVVISGLLSIPPTYISTAKLLIKTEQQVTPNFLSGIANYREAQLIDPSSRKIETEMQILTSRGLAENVVNKLALSDEQIYHPPLIHVVRRINGWRQMIMGWIGVKKQKKITQAEVVDAFIKSVTAIPLKSKQAETTSNMVAVELRATDPKIARLALASLLESYFPYGLQIDQRAGEQLLAVVRENLNSAVTQLQSDQQALQKFLARSGRTAEAQQAVVDTSARRYDSGQLAALQSDAEAARGRRAAAQQEATANAFAAGGRTEDAKVALLRSRLTQLELDLVEAREQYTENSGPVEALKGTIANISQRLTLEMERSAEDEAKLLSLRRNYSIAEEQFVELNRKYNQIQLFLKMTPSPTSLRELVEEPIEPDSSEWKRKFLVGIVGSLGGLLLGLALAGFKEMNDHRLQSSHDVSRYLQMGTLAAVRRLSGAALAQFRSGDPKVLEQEAMGVRFRNLTGKLWQQKVASGKNGGVVLLVTCTGYGDGCSTVSEALAAFAARLSWGPVLLLKAAGDEYSAPGAEPERVAHVPGLEHFTLPSFGEEENWREGSIPLLQSLRQRYSLVVVDGPPLVKCSALLIDSAEAIILTVNAASTRREALLRAMELADFQPRQLAGVILNCQPRHLPRWLYNSL